MTKSFTITNEMREKIADQLTAKAIEKHGKRISAKLEKLNADFWADHRAKVDGVLQIDPKRYPELIQAGCLAVTTQVEPKSDRASMIAFSFSRRTEDEKEKAIFDLVRRCASYRGVERLIKRESYRETFSLHFVSQDGSVPILRGMEVIEPGSKLDKAAKAIRADLGKILQAAKDFHGQTMDILVSVRSSRQLTDLFPEAAKLLPEPVKKTTEVAPIELVNSVRSMLNKGVPDMAEAN